MKHLTIIASLLLSSVLAEQDKLLFLMDIVTHGASAPVNQADIDATNTSYPLGAGQLTPFGMR